MATTCDRIDQRLFADRLAHRVEALHLYLLVAGAGIPGNHEAAIGQHRDPRLAQVAANSVDRCLLTDRIARCAESLHRDIVGRGHDHPAAIGEWNNIRGKIGTGFVFDQFLAADPVSRGIKPLELDDVIPLLFQLASPAGDPAAIGKGRYAGGIRAWHQLAAGCRFRIAGCVGTH